jgi:outer membrane protein OmpA-like peptidoglycan-associated protein
MQKQVRLHGASFRSALRFFTLALLLGASACASMSRTQQGGAIGAAAGGIIGAVIDDNTARGAIIGAVVGGTAGAVIGREMDQQAAELEGTLADAEVERIGEGIRVTFDSGILFAFDSSDLQSAARENLTTLSRSLGEYPNTDVTIVGHTDATGSDSYNQALSERRADSAASYLVQQGVSRDRITSEGRGELEPVASNDDETGRQLNRRVEVAIFASEEYRSALEQQYGQN